MSERGTLALFVRHQIYSDFRFTEFEICNIMKKLEGDLRLNERYGTICCKYHHTNTYDVSLERLAKGIKK